MPSTAITVSEPRQAAGVSLRRPMNRVSHRGPVRREADAKCVNTLTSPASVPLRLVERLRALPLQRGPG